MGRKSHHSFWNRFSTETTKNSFLLAAIVACLPFSASAQVRITEFVYDAPGPDEKNEWIELFNSGGNPVDISKWKVADKSRHVLNLPPKNGSRGTTTLQPHSFVIIADDASTFNPPGLALEVSVIDTSINLSNAGGVITLYDARGKLIDSATYVSSLGGAGDGNSIQKNSGGKWVVALPTPGKMNAEVSLSRTDEKKVVKKEKKISPVPKKTSNSNKREPARKIMDDSLPDSSDDRAEPDLEESAQRAAVGDSVTVSRAPLWFMGALFVSGVAAIASLMALRSKKNEWEIVEEKD